MTPTLIPITYQQSRMMDAGTFTLFHAWQTDDEETVEYWRGIEGNGACIRLMYQGHVVTISHYPTPGEAIKVLTYRGFPVPGVVAAA